MKLLVVDGANVVGSVPDRWWADRAGAASRLQRGLVSADLPFDRVLLVLEGKARAGVPAGSEGAVSTVHAPASGDDEIVARTRQAVLDGADVTLATADRGLIARVAGLEVGILGPRALRERLQPAGPEDRDHGR